MPQNRFAGRKATPTSTASMRYLTPLRNPRHMAGVSSLALMLGSAGLGVVALPAPVAAADWTGATSNDWFVTGNWSTGAVPISGEVVWIDTTVPNPAVVNGANAVAGNVIVG